MTNLISKFISELITSALIMIAYIKYVIPIILKSYPYLSEARCIGMFLVYSVVGYYMIKMLSYLNSDSSDNFVDSRNKAVTTVYLLSKLLLFPGKLFLTPIVHLIKLLR